MIEEKLNEIEKIIDKEIKEYKILSSLYDEKKNYLIKNDIKNLSDTDNKIIEKLNILQNIENERKLIDEELGLKNTNISNYIELAHKNSLDIEKNLCLQKQSLSEINSIISGKERTIAELIKHGIKTVNKLINIIVGGLTKSNQYDNCGKNTKDGYLNISSIEEEV